MDDPIVVQCVNSSPSWILVASLIATTIIAIITAYVAYLNYSTRQHLSDIKEKHTEDLKNCLNSWKLEIEQPTLFSLDDKQTPQIPMPIEKTAIFTDIITEHRDLSLFVEWVKFHDIIKKLQATMDKLFNIIETDVSSTLGRASVDLFDDFYLSIYRAAISSARGEPIARQYLRDAPYIAQSSSKTPPFFIQVHDGTVVTDYMDNETANIVASHYTNVLTNLSKTDSKEYKYVEIAKSAINVGADLHAKVKVLSSLIEQMLAVPIFIEECQYVLRSVPPIFPSPRWFRKKLSDYFIIFTGIRFIGRPIIRFMTNVNLHRFHRRKG